MTAIDTAQARRVSLLVLIRDRGMIILWLLMVAVFSVWAAPAFGTFTNAMLILSAAAITSIFAAAVAFGVLSGALDLSVPGTAAFSAVLAAKIIEAGVPVWLGLLAGVGAGGLVGVVNGLIVLRGLNPLVVTIGTLTALTGLAAVVSGGDPISGFTQAHFLGSDSFWRIPAPAFVVVGVYLLGWIFLTRTRDGTRLLAVGGNAEAARRSGVPADRYRVLGFVLSGGCAALGGIVTAATITQAAPTAGTGVLFDALTAVALSGMPLTGGRGSLPRVLVGALIIATISSALVIRNVQSYWTTVVTGVLLIAALSAERLLSTAISARLVAHSASSAHAPQREVSS